MAQPSEPPSEQQNVVPAQPTDRYRHLPARVRLEDMIASKEVDPAPDPAGGRDAERDFMLRYAG